MTHMSAIARTEPGATRGWERPRPFDGRETRWTFPRTGKGRCKATEQFEISDQRTPEQVVGATGMRAMEPVWKDWDAALDVV